MHAIIEIVKRYGNEAISKLIGNKKYAKIIAQYEVKVCHKF